MMGTQRLHDAGQSIWLDNITRNLLATGGPERYINEFSVTGLTSNPTILDHAIKNSEDYNPAIREKAARGSGDEEIFFELALASELPIFWTGEQTSDSLTFGANAERRERPSV
jgi:transaldolase